MMMLMIIIIIMNDYLKARSTEDANGGSVPRDSIVEVIKEFPRILHFYNSWKINNFTSISQIHNHSLFFLLVLLIIIVWVRFRFLCSKPQTHRITTWTNRKGKWQRRQNTKQMPCCLLVLRRCTPKHDENTEMPFLKSFIKITRVYA